MPVVTIEMLEGRTVEQKRELVRAVTSAVAKAIKCPEDAVSVVIHDLPKTNWATSGKLYLDGPGK